MMLLPSVQFKEPSLRSAHSPSPHSAPFGHVWHDSDFPAVPSPVMMA